MGCGYPLYISFQTRILLGLENQTAMESLRLIEIIKKFGA